MRLPESKVGERTEPGARWLVKEKKQKVGKKNGGRGGKVSVRGIWRKRDTFRRIMNGRVFQKARRKKKGCQR